ncbi:MAG: SDR family oxidoreductase [Ruaniaceae bacterium]|nr:SDR family oxidoreductase [Ruaniaceae bacterium]
MRNALRGQTLLVTGGGSGLGRLMALGAATRGARVIIWDLNADAAASVRDEILAQGGRALSDAVDVSDKNAVAAAALGAGSVDVLVNNAGVVTGRNLMDASDEQIERTFAVNVLPLYWVTRAFLGGMIERGRGTVVTVASAAGLVGVAKQTDYSASKWAAIGFAESLRAEMAKEHTGVTSLVVCPYYIATGMFEGVQTKFPLLLPIMKPEPVVEKFLNAIEAGREQLIMPPFVRVMPIVRMLPPKAFDAVINFFGINSGMDHFVGRATAPKSEAPRGS